MKKNVQRIMATILTVIMMVSMLPFNVFASDLDTDMFVEPAVEAVSVPGEEREVESTEEYVLEEAAETVDESLDEIQYAEAADPVAADGIVDDSEEDAEVVEEITVEEPDGLMALETVGAGADGTGFPASFTYSNKTYTKYGDPVGHPARFRIDGVNDSTWVDLNRTVISEGTIYYQEYRVNGSSSDRIIVYEIPTTVEISRGTGYYIDPNCFRHGGEIQIGLYTNTMTEDVYFGNMASTYYIRNGRAIKRNVQPYGPLWELYNGRTAYGFDSNFKTAKSDRNPVDVMYTLYSGSSTGPVIRPTYTITYKDGVDDQVIFEDQVYKDENAVEGNKTPHFKWEDTDGDPVRPGYRFTGWKNQSGTEYANSDDVAAVTITGNATYTAQWAPNSITVSKEVALGRGVSASDIDQTLYFALWDPTTNDWFKKDGQIVYKTITITDGVPIGNAVFDENDLLESLDYSVSELKVASGTAVTELSVNDEFEVDGKTIKVSGIKAQELDASGAVIKDNDNNTHLDTTNAAYVKFINTYTSDQTDSFELFKKWYDYQDGQRVDVTETIQDVTATITLYRTINGNTYEEVESKTLDGTEPTPWKAEFTNLKHTDDSGNVYTYAARETACTAGYKAYSTSSSEKPMPATEYKSSHQNIFNIQDHYGIYHSSDETTEWFAVGEKIKLVTKVRSGYLYGGYYNYTETGNHKGTALTTYEKTGLDEDFTATENNTIYYLKEVPDTYLNPRIFITYDTNEGHTPKYALRQLWAIMDLDASCVDGDGNAYGEYGGYGFIIDDDIQIASSKEFICQTLEVNYPDKDKEEYTVKKMFNSGTDEDRLFVRDLTADYLTDTSASAFTLRAYFKTPDGLIVTGKKQRTVHLANRTFAADAAPSIQWKQEGGGIWQETATPGSEVAADTRSLRASTTIPSVRTYKIKSTPDILTYTVTKVDDGKNESQVVQAGDNTGKITYAGKTGYVFAGWYLDKAYTKAADFSAVTGDMTVYAKYVKASAIGLSFTKKSSKSGSVTLNATLKITGAPDLADAAVSCDYKGKTSTVKFTGAKTTKSGKTTVSTYAGTVAISGLANKSSFTAAISYKTPDGTIVILADKTCKYTSGKVTVK